MLNYHYVRLYQKVRLEGLRYSPSSAQLKSYFLLNYWLGGGIRGRKIGTEDICSCALTFILLFQSFSFLITKRIFWIKNTLSTCATNLRPLYRGGDNPQDPPGPSHLTPHLYWNLNDTICALPPRTFVFTFAIWICWVGLREQWTPCKINIEVLTTQFGTWKAPTKLTWTQQSRDNSAAPTHNYKP